MCKNETGQGIILYLSLHGVLSLCHKIPKRKKNLQVKRELSENCGIELHGMRSMTVGHISMGAYLYAAMLSGAVDQLGWNAIQKLKVHFASSSAWFTPTFSSALPNPYHWNDCTLR